MNDPVVMSEEVTSAAITNKNSEYANHLVRLATGEDLHINWVEMYVGLVV